MTFIDRTFDRFQSNLAATISFERDKGGMGAATTVSVLTETLNTFIGFHAAGKAVKAFQVVKSTQAAALGYAVDSDITPGDFAGTIVSLALGTAALFVLPATAGVAATIGTGIAVYAITTAAGAFAGAVVDQAIAEGWPKAFVDGLSKGIDSAMDFGGDVLGAVGNAISDLGSGIWDFFAEDAPDFISNAGSDFAAAIRSQLMRLLDPVVLDLDGNGIELISRQTSGVYFDMDGDGVKELTGWVSPTDGLLAIDKNKNGTIDSIDELIGDMNQSGFAELITYDANKDRVIDRKDDIWTKLRVWVDANSNGITDEGELRTMAQMNIRSIDLNYTAVSFVAEGNQIHEQSAFEYTDGTTGLVADIWFDVSNVTSGSMTGATGNVTVDSLPDIRGSGDVVSLRSAMQKSGALTTLVQGFVAQGTDSLLTARSQVEQIIYRWAGVQAVATDSRGENFDGRKLAALEAFLGTPFQVNNTSDPLLQSVTQLTAAWDKLVDGVQARLLMAGALGDALADTARVLPEVNLLLTLKTPDELMQALAAAQPAGDALTVASYWSAVLPLARAILQDSAGTATLPASSNTIVAAALADAGLAGLTDLLDDGIAAVPAGAQQLAQSGAWRLGAGNDQIAITGGRMVVFGGAGNDLIYVTGNNSAARYIDGGAGDDQLQGGVGDDWLDGGLGQDIMAGGSGNDIYMVDNAGDLVMELANAGIDEVRSTISHKLSDNVERLTLVGTGKLNGTGNELANLIRGNGAANRLEGLAGNDTLDGGAGADTMVGGLGNDTYYVDNAGDKIIETGNDVDTVHSTINYTLGARLEHLVLTGSAIKGTGNALGNRITGNDRDNVLDGKAGADTMDGGLGNDTYIVDHRNDQVVEQANGGIDTVQASVSHSLAANVEHLILTGDLNLSGSGNSLNNKITGNAGDNALNGGEGADTLIGGDGDDTYYVDNSGDVVTEAAGQGRDLVYSTLADYTLTENVEDLSLNWGYGGTTRNGTGNALANVITGSNTANILRGMEGNDTLYGGGGNDTLEGGAGHDLLDGGDGDDRMVGGAGNDLYIVNSSGDVVVEASGGGNDTVQASVTHTLAAQVEHLVLTGSAAIDGSGNGLANRITGNSGNNRLDGKAGADTMEGGSGNDTYVVDSAKDVIIELAGQGQDRVEASLTWTLGANLEELVLTGSTAINGFGNELANRITGNGAKNRLEGGAGNDTLDGGAGADTMVGGRGEDSYYVDHAGDKIIETGSDIDTVYAAINYTLGARLENLVLTGQALKGTGNGLNNRITGNDGNNTLDGGAGDDSMMGGKGDDIYIVDSESDWVSEYANEGIDLVRASVSYTLGSNVENLVLTGSEDLNGSGNSLANRLTGNAGDNVLNGGSGADTMIGGKGDDTYIVDDIGDVVTEAKDGGTDTVQTSLAAYTLGANVENLVLYANWMDSVARNGTGNAAHNTITGNNGANVLSGLAGNDVLYGNDGNDTLLGGTGDDWLDGGTGNDSMVGGTGNDTYVVNAAQDIVVEKANEGIDTVMSSVSWILSQHVENVVLTGTAHIDAQGNGANNRLTGNSGNNRLDGGAGADTMAGGAGNDIYTVDHIGDVVLEMPGAGIDEVRSTIDYTLGFSVENLTLLGTANRSGTGNAEANVIVGNAGSNRLTGGLGRDTLTGGAGADTFVFLSTEDSGTDSWSADLITDFSQAQGDRIDLRAIDAKPGTAIVDAFEFIGAGAFTAAGQVRSYTSGNTTYVQLNTDAALNSPEMVITLTGAITLTAADFLL